MQDLVDETDHAVIYETAETLLCAGSDFARLGISPGKSAAHDVAGLLLEAAEIPAATGPAPTHTSNEPAPTHTLNPVTLHHTCDVLEMIRDGHGNAALSMHLAFAAAEMERDELEPDSANLLDIYVAGVVLDAERWRREQCLPLWL